MSSSRGTASGKYREVPFPTHWGGCPQEDRSQGGDRVWGRWGPRPPPVGSNRAAPRRTEGRVSAGRSQSAPRRHPRERRPSAARKHVYPGLWQRRAPPPRGRIDSGVFGEMNGKWNVVSPWKGAQPGVKRSEVLPCAPTRMHPESVLGERSQAARPPVARLHAQGVSGSRPVAAGAVGRRPRTVGFLCGELPVDQQVKRWRCPCCGVGSDPWPGNVHVLQARVEKRFCGQGQGLHSLEKIADPLDGVLERATFTICQSKHESLETVPAHPAFSSRSPGRCLSLCSALYLLMHLQDASGLEPHVVPFYRPGN